MSLQNSHNQTFSFQIFYLYKLEFTTCIQIILCEYKICMFDNKVDMQKD